MEPNSQQTPPPQKSYHPMVVLQEGEQVVCEIKRHPVGILTMYISSGLIIIVLVAILAVLIPSLSTQYGSTLGQLVPALYVGGALLLLVIGLMLYIATVVYWQNQWIVTTDSLTEITQNGLFGRQVSQLSLDNLEDVTVDQSGILPHMLNYGTLRVESAGEHSKFVFIYCPDPSEYARQILDTHEKLLMSKRGA